MAKSTKDSLDFDELYGFGFGSAFSRLSEESVVDGAFCHDERETIPIPTEQAPGDGECPVNVVEMNSLSPVAVPIEPHAPNALSTDSPLPSPARSWRPASSRYRCSTYIDPSASSPRPEALVAGPSSQSCNAEKSSGLSLILAEDLEEETPIDEYENKGQETAGMIAEDNVTHCNDQERNDECEDVEDAACSRAEEVVADLDCETQNSDVENEVRIAHPHVLQEVETTNDVKEAATERTAETRNDEPLEPEGKAHEHSSNDCVPLSTQASFPCDAPSLPPDILPLASDASSHLANGSEVSSRRDSAGTEPPSPSIVAALARALQDEDEGRAGVDLAVAAVLSHTKVSRSLAERVARLLPRVEEGCGGSRDPSERLGRNGGSGSIGSIQARLMQKQRPKTLGEKLSEVRSISTRVHTCIHSYLHTYIYTYI